jgi:ABC-type proline/glycine betaine transport system ATPase subunit
MDNLLPILLGLVFFGFKYYNKTQKDKKTAATNPMKATPSSDNPANSLDDFIRQFMGEEKEEFAAVETSNFEENNSTSDWMNEMHKEEPESIEYMPKKAEKTKPIRQFETIQNKENQEMEMPDFDLKKAVVYDAILNPPYI